jgi:hypothetical protein
MLLACVQNMGYTAYPDRKSAEVALSSELESAINQGTLSLHS